MNIDVPQIAQLIIKVFVLVGLAVYSVFGVVMVRQEHLMSNVLAERSEPLLKILVYIHLVASVGLFFLAFVIL